ncbi:hypothetical protein [Allomuricauda sp. SCSIO 65647]|uniref:hypothetical protein n=1 Tax=Allomuricauda sp. SCSIO 65647 TaxID=2908843 RepID=UPI001F3F8CE3|nr:hypothetical protein [Muricauda sp. SCSIO 65647]UJH68566.1 hypothetical protein L0P89_04980 [Muricauda sp. SCSIO 65647]
MKIRGLYFFLNLLFAVQLMAQSGVGTKEDREALFDAIVKMTMQREAFSDFKNKALNFDPIENMQKLRQEFVDAETNDDFWFALVKLSAARHDKHLSIEEVENGLTVPQMEEGRAPIRFHPDYSSKKLSFFVSDHSKNIADYCEKRAPSIGDELLEVNGVALADFVEQVRPYIAYSNENNFKIRTADALSKRSAQWPGTFFKDSFHIKLKPKKGRPYSLVVPYLNEVDWQYGRFLRNYEGYELAWEKESFAVYLPKDKSSKTILLWWYGFRKDLRDAVDELVNYAETNGMLAHDLIIDAVNSRGGSQGAYALARFSSRPFKTTGGNLRLSDITDDFIADRTEKYLSKKQIMDGSSPETEDDGSWMMEWLHGPVLKGLERGQDYSNNVPFKCAHLPYYSDWVMQPAKKHFTGKLVLFSGPWGGSHMDQFSAMVNDNDLGHTFGMPSGGYSNTWEWEEDLYFPNGSTPVVKFMWNIGHTIRPNGQVLEGNPALVDDYVPVTKDNYLDYKNILLGKALNWLEQ